MTYDIRDTLPKGVTHALPGPAQETYLAAFKRALKEHKVPRDRRSGEFDLREVSAHMQAWAAVKKGMSGVSVVRGMNVVHNKDARCRLCL